MSETCEHGRDLRNSCHECGDPMTVRTTTNRQRALAIVGCVEGASYLLTADVLRVEQELDAAERRGAMKVLEFATGHADWNDIADLHNWLTDDCDLDDSIRRLTEAKRSAELKAKENKR